MQDKKIIIRKAKIPEAIKIKRLKYEVFDKVISKYYNHEQVNAFKKANTIPLIKDRIKKGNNFIILLDNKLIATIYINNANRPAGFAVKPKLQGKGYGRILLTHIEKEFIKRGYKRITLNSTTNSVEFYKKLGYKKVKNNTMIIFGVKFPTIFMEKILK